MLAEVIPELWLLSRRNVQLQGQVTQENVGDVAVITPKRAAAQKVAAPLENIGK
jgi:hypothetical protein